MFLKDSYLALKIDFVNLLFPSGLGRSVAQLGRAPVLGTGCRVFKSPRSDHFSRFSGVSSSSPNNLTLLMGGFCPCSAHFKVVI